MTMYRTIRLMIPAAAWIAMAPGQTPGPTPKINPSTEQVGSIARTLSDLHLKQQPTSVRLARLEIRPSGDPIYVVEESEWDGVEWRTFRVPKVDPVSKNSDGVAVQGYDVISYREK